METYGVCFEGFEPSCGWPMYRHAKDERLPCLKAEVERWCVRCDEAAAERTAIKGLKGDLECLAKSRDGIVQKLRSTVLSQGKTVNDLMPLGVEEREVEANRTWQELSAWLDESRAPIKEIAFYHKHAWKRADFNLNFLVNCFESAVIDVRFWTRTLELQHAYWVFEKASLKYKTKICRELVKALGDYIGDCLEQLGR